MIFIGLLTHEQKQLGYFVTQDEDFIYIYHGKNTDNPRWVGVFDYATTTVREIREAAERDSFDVHRRERAAKPVRQ